MEARPRTVTIVAAFLFAATALAAVVGVSLLFQSALLDRMWELNEAGAEAFRSRGRISGVLLLLVGAWAFAAAAGLIRRRRWAWWLAIGLFAIDGCGDVVSFTMTGDWLRSASGAAICSAFLYFLTRRRARLYFRSRP
jgi:hypothetical protein